MSERRKSFFAKDTNADKTMLQYLSDMQIKTKRNSVTKIGSNNNKASSQQPNVDTRKRSTIQLTNQDIEVISEKINQSIFLQNDADLNQLITGGPINNRRESLLLLMNNSSNINTQLVIPSPTRNNSKRTTTRKMTNMPIVPVPFKPRKTYKNSQDLFSQTLDLKLKHRSDITNQLLLNTQIRILHKKQEKKKNADNMPLFNNTIQLNKYIINQYHIGNNACGLYSKKKQKITEDTFSVIRKKKIKEIQKQNKTALMMTLDNTEHNYTFESNDCSFNNYTEENVKEIRKQYYDNKEKERLKLANTFLRNLEDLSNIQYQQMDSNNLINYKNLSRVMQVMKIKQKSKINSITKQKSKLQEDEARVILATSKLGPPLYAKTKLKKETHGKFLGIKGSYFGYPV